MTQAPTGIAEADRRLIHSFGLPLKPRPDLVSFMSDGRAVFSVRGIAFFRYLFDFLGMTEDLAKVRTAEDYSELERRVGLAQIARANAKLAGCLASGDVPFRDRELVEATLSGSRAELLSAAARSLEYCTPGSTVVPMSFKS